MMRISSNLVLLSLLLVACSNPGGQADAQNQQRISQFEKAGFCDLLIDKSGVYHAVFQESPDFGKPIFIYYSSSTNKGATWSKPITLSNDGSGNGAGYARIVQDGNGIIYAIWKRYGNTATQYPSPSVTLDGPGGYTPGTLFYKALSGGTWSNAVQLNEAQQGQDSWFATVSPQGVVYVFWSQASPQSIKNNQTYWYYCDYLRAVTLSGASHSAYMDLNQPTPNGPYNGFPTAKKGAINLNGYVDNAGLPHLIYEDIPDDVQELKYFDGKTLRVVYNYPKYNAGNTFYNPAHLLVDEKGVDHILFLPAPSTLESEQIWDMNLSTNQNTVLTSIQQPGIKISGFQATQGPKGSMAITFEAGGYSGNTEGYGMFYSNGVWKNVGLTNNAAKEKFFSRDFIGLGGYVTNISTLTRYNSQYASIAYDAAGHKKMLMTIAAYWIGGGGYSISSPSIVFVPVDQ